ncbi:MULTISPECIES: ABC transporter substrate-binding protein [Roseobacteraceae]|jgi:ABC-type transport system substrate-binding protein|uniref:Nickel-binding periplasmic protein n=1 Tax=Pseudosulfitobacter pseudonitzschiae TaxID=1402135 RepID=A0A221K4H1_9RHOB|nr:MULTISPECIES: ABC transporter substrate-binding protein [Roseobacteraceae]ASM73896.1 nickel-binding periplasmic protein [Pseudosulfitobacter pseudonitzschiae]
MKRMDRRALFASGAAAALLAATGVQAQIVPRSGGRLRAALSGASRNDGWDLAPNGLFMMAAQHTVFEALTEVAADGSLRGALATGWSGSDGGQTWAFDLRPGVMFHDGNPLRAQDAVTSLAPYVDGSVRADGTTRVVVRLVQAQADLPYVLSGVLIRPVDADARAQGVGTGLYRVQKFDAGRQFIGARVPDHYKSARAGWFDTVEFVSIPAQEVRAEALRAGLVDAADVSGADVLADDRAFMHLPDAARCQQIVHRDIGVPAEIGTRHALDDLRMAERWWRV